MVYILIISHCFGVVFLIFTFSRFVSEGGICPVVKLRVRAGESIQEAVRRFRKLCERSGLRKEMRRKAYYEKPSERRRREELKRLRKARQHQISRV
jgi:small subunit ribosomal protein S21